MKFVVLSGVFALASAGLAMASVGPANPADTVKDGALTALPVAAADAVLIGKKEDMANAVTPAAVDCSADPSLPICAAATAKN
jgi:hypothetical protein